jgi:hypothetical protein
MNWLLLFLLVAATLVGAFIVTRRRNEIRRDSMDTKVDAFRRHMDALSPAARREVIDRVRAAQRDDVEG